MRVTAAQVYRSQLRQTRNKSADAFEAQAKAISGRRILRPSDDPAGAARSIRIREMRGDIGTARGKIDTVNDELLHQEQALGSMTNLVSRARELAIQMANPTSSTLDRASAAVEIEQLQSGLIALSNTRLGDKRLFAGSQTDGDAFDSTGTYLGDSNTISVQAHLTATVQVTLAGDALLRGASGGPDIVQALNDLETALNADNLTGIQSSLTDLEESTDWIVQQRSLVGSRMSLVDTLDTHLQDLEVNMVQEQSEIEDADTIEAFSEVMRTKQAFEAALSVTAAARISNVFEMLGV
jgi:flagellar hook-associated protein 3 FlgL